MAGETPVLLCPHRVAPHRERPGWATRLPSHQRFQHSEELGIGDGGSLGAPSPGAARGDACVLLVSCKSMDAHAQSLLSEFQREIATLADELVALKKAEARLARKTEHLESGLRALRQSAAMPESSGRAEASEG